MVMTRWALLAAGLLGVGSCTPSSSNPLVAGRPYSVMTPKGYDPTKPAPVVVALHGYMDTSTDINDYLQLGPLSDVRGFIYATPEGTRDSVGNQFWNATDACCNYEGSTVDDVAYLTAVLDDLETKYAVDRSREYFVGHSNGGFMVNRMACDRSSRVAAIISLAGANWFDMTRCRATEPVSVLQIHGDADDNVLYDGGTRHDIPYPSAVETVQGWAQRNGCTGPLQDTGQRLDLDTTLAGDETRISAASGCPDAGAAELWTVEGGSHVLFLGTSAPDLLWSWLAAHPKP
jgi:polyhydroxybutyrate depolymerase